MWVWCLQYNTWTTTILWNRLGMASRNMAVQHTRVMASLPCRCRIGLPYKDTMHKSRSDLPRRNTVACSTGT